MSFMSFVKDTVQKSTKLHEMTQPLYTAYRAAIMRGAQRRQGINPRKVVFSSFQGMSYSDNPRYISERLHELCPEAEIVWLFREGFLEKAKVPDYVRTGLLISREGLIEQATARFWVDNFKRSRTIYLDDKRQYYINTWHGDRGFKRVGDDNEKLRKQVGRRLEERCAMMIAGSEFGANNYRTAFHFKGEVLMDGCPRNDILVRNDPAVAADVRRRVGIPPEKHILLYAPTYRDDREWKTQTAALDVCRTLDHLERTRNEPWVCLYRAHYLNQGLIVKEDLRVMDASAWPDMSELLLISDMLITDYSSCGGDFALLRRPLFLYQADVREYLDVSRSFYFDMEDSPFLVARSQKELERLIDTTDAEAARENCEALDRFFGTTENGHATDAVCKYIMDRMKD